MKTNWFIKSLSPFLGLGLVVGLLLFLSNSSATAQDVQVTPLPGNSLDPLPPFEVAGGVYEQSPMTSSLVAPNADSPLLALGWTSPYSETTTDLAWGDYDNDGDLDLLVANGSTGPNRLYNNTGGVLTFVSGSTMGNLNCWTSNENTTSVNWYDYDRDGYLDITIGNHTGRSCFYHNDGQGSSFTKDWTASGNQPTTSISWAGWFSDGFGFGTYMAIGNDGQTSAIYLLDTGQLFPFTFPHAYNTKSLAWGDYDNDGDPDLAMGNFGQPTIVFRNDEPTGNTRIRMTPAYTITRNSDSSYLTNQVAWGDMDGDGYLDLALGNGTDSGRTDPDKVFCNTGGEDPSFNDCWTSNDTSSTTDIAWGDYDGDGDLDLAAISQADLGTTRLYLNEAGMLDTQTGGTSFNDGALDGNAVAWADVDGDGDLELSLGYDGSVDPFPASVSLYTNIGGSFAPLDLANSSNDTRGLAWGDMDNDGYLDLAVANSGSPVRVYRSDGETLVEAWTAPASYNTRSVAWGDYDRDGDLDLALGNGQSGGGAPNVIYRNVNNTLTSSIAYLVDDGSNTTAVAWGDMNGDGTLDLIEANYETFQTNTIFWNIWDPLSYRYEFTQTLNFGAASDRSTSLAIGDFDQDYDLDILVGNDGQVDRVYVNNGSGSFTTLNIPVPTGVCANNKTRSVAWADWDGDGDLDIAEALDGCLRVLRTDHSGSSWSFTQVWGEASNNLAPNSVSWGDFEGDGDPDLAVGLTGQFGLKSRIYRNTGSALALFWTANLEEVARTLAVGWGDVDNDGDLDLALGNDLTQSNPDRLYINTILGSTYLANDPTSAYIYRPDWWVNQSEGWHFSAGRVVGDPAIPLEYILTDNQGDRAFRVQHQVSWDGGYHWEPAWEYLGSQSGEWSNVPSSREGAMNVFWWDALNQFLAHQNIPFNPNANTYVPFGQSIQEMDIAFRVVPWAHPEHGGPIQRPRYGSNTTFMRADMRPDWSDSAKTFDGETPEAVHPGDIIYLTVEISQTDHGMPPEAYIIDHLPDELYMEDYGLAWADSGSSFYYSEITSSIKTITWTGAIDYDYLPAFPHIFRVHFAPRVMRPLPNGLDVTNCADLYDGLHAPFERCLTFEISSTPKTDESWKLVNGVTENVVLPGELLTYTIVLTNTGTDNAHSVIMTDVVSTDTVWLNSLVATGGSVTYADGIINWRGELNVFEPVFLTYTVQVEKPLPGNTLITNTFLLQDNINPVWAATPVTTSVQAPDLRASTKTDLPDPVELDDPLFYTIILRNTGGLTALPAYLTDPIPAGSRYITNTLVVDPATATYGYDANRDRIFWIGNLAPSEIVTLTYGIYAGLTAASPNGILTNTAYITDTWGGPVTLVATTTVTVPDLSGSFKLASTDEVVIGDLITYTIVVSNTGGYGPGVTATDPIPDGSEFVPNSFSTTGGNGGYFGNTVNWDGTLDSLESASFSFAVTAGCPNNLATAVISNVVSIESPSGLILERTALTYVNLPTLNASTVTVNQTSVASGDIVRYTITIPNTGVFGNLYMIDNLPNELEWVSGHATTGLLTYNAGQRRVRWEGPLDTGQQVVITIDVRVRENLIADQIENGILISDGCQEFLFMPPTLQVGNTIYLPLVYRRR